MILRLLIAFERKFILKFFDARLVGGEFLAEIVYGFLIDYGLLLWRDSSLPSHSGHQGGHHSQPSYALGTKRTHS